MSTHYHADAATAVDDYSQGATGVCAVAYLGETTASPSKNSSTHACRQRPIRFFRTVYPRLRRMERKCPRCSGFARRRQPAESLPGFLHPDGNAPMRCRGPQERQSEQKDFNAERGILTAWEPMEKNLGMHGLAIIVSPKAVDKQAEDEKEQSRRAETRTDNPISYWTGFAWDRAGRITSAEAWKKYVDESPRACNRPIESPSRRINSAKRPAKNSVIQYRVIKSLGGLLFHHRHAGVIHRLRPAGIKDTATRCPSPARRLN